MNLFINGQWQQGNGPAFSSLNPATGEALWQGSSANPADVDAAVKAARAAFEDWGFRPFEERLAVLRKFQEVAKARQAEMAEAIAKETGKVLWDSKGEAAGVAGKLDASLKAYHERTGEKQMEASGVQYGLRHKPHGVMAVFGPYNFPAHLPNGHIIPALLAGNTVVFKPSEQTPMVGELLVKFYEEAGIPKGVINLVQGEKETGIALAGHDGIDGLLFTGSSATGKLLNKQFADKPGKILALELGGNNPLVVHEVSDLKAAAYTIIQSAYITSGQRCTCARRLIVPVGDQGDALLETLIAMTQSIKVGAWNETPEPFMGPLISTREADRILDTQASLLKSGGKALLEMKKLKENTAFVSPGLIDVTGVKNLPDEEYFGPLLQVIRVKDFDAAIAEANNTAYGLAAGILTDSNAHFETFLKKVRAGIVNWNRPTTGAAAVMPFGGWGESGNHRPAAYYAADYCAWPVASAESERVQLPEKPSPGLSL